MKSFAATTILALAATSLAAPTDYTPKGGWESVKYPADAGANLPSYPEPKGGWENVKYPPGTGSGSTGCPDTLFKFTSTYHITATPDQVVNGTTPTGGLAGAKGYYNFGIDSTRDLICWDIKLTGFRGEYQSAAKTATHIHEAAKGKSGPARLAFPNPVKVEGKDERYSVGCMTGPFTTGIVTNGTDSGAGFMVKRIEENPSAFFADVHSSLAVPGAVRGQLA